MQFAMFYGNTEQEIWKDFSKYSLRTTIPTNIEQIVTSTYNDSSFLLTNLLELKDTKDQNYFCIIQLIE
jgi:hypothetical protein